MMLDDKHEGAMTAGTELISVIQIFRSEPGDTGFADVSFFGGDMLKIERTLRECLQSAVDATPTPEEKPRQARLVTKEGRVISHISMLPGGGFKRLYPDA